MRDSLSETQDRHRAEDESGDDWRRVETMETMEIIDDNNTVDSERREEAVNWRQN